MAADIAVYLFVGFLESGKTKFIQEALEDSNFNSGEKTLILCCEEGEEEYDPSTFYGKNVYVENIDSVLELNEENLRNLVKKYRAERVMVEYNGMWLLQDLYTAFPRNWIIYQQFTFIDSTTFEMYNANMRNLMYDKIKDTNMVVFNRFRDTDDKLIRHKIVRAANRTCEIVYDYGADKIEYDDIIDPPPYDINAPIVEIGDRDYAWFYSDLVNDPKPFEGKTLNFLGMALTNKQLPANTFLIGRELMNCCAADVQYAGLIAEVAQGPLTVKNKGWYRVTGKVEYKFHPNYSGKGPVLKVTSMKSVEQPSDPVATFV